MISHDVKLSDCPVLKRKIWDEEDVLVAADWAMEHGAGVAPDEWAGYVNEPLWVSRVVTLATFREIVRLGVDPIEVVRFDEMADDFTAAYVECALWAESDQSDDSGGQQLSENYDANDIDPATLASMIADCTDFQEANEEDLYQSGLSDEYAGHDFWLTRNGHGAGFWDRGLGETGKKLTDAAHAYGEFNIYVGDDGKIHGG